MSRVCSSSIRAAQQAGPARQQVSRHVLGMPMLQAHGLSESWLQKTCGDLHWQALAQAMGRSSEQWVDRSGRRVYAAFCGLSLRSSGLEAAREGQQLHIDSRLRALGPSQAWSQHHLYLDGISVGLLDLVSAFVSHAEPGRNATVRRAEMPAGIGDAAEATVPEAAERYATLRQQRQHLLAGASRGEWAGTRHWTVTPCPRQDFNGAGLLYFPTFSALADRALWQWGLWPANAPLRQRECVYLSNVEIGEPVVISLLSSPTPGPAAGGDTALSLLLRSGVDQRPLAQVTVLIPETSSPSCPRSSRPPRTADDPGTPVSEAPARRTF